MIVVVQSFLRKSRAVPELFSLHLFILPAKRHLPCGIHLSATNHTRWENNENFPTGHHTINALAFESGLKYVEGPLKTLNVLGKPITRLEYSTSRARAVRRVSALLGRLTRLSLRELLKNSRLDWRILRAQQDIGHSTDAAVSPFSKILLIRINNLETSGPRKH